MNIPLKLDSVQLEQLKIAMRKDKRSFNQKEVSSYLIHLIEEKYQCQRRIRICSWGLNFFKIVQSTTTVDRPRIID